MTTLTVTSKGQVTLRKDMLRHLGVAQGDRLEVRKLPNGRVEVRAARAGGSITELFGLLADKKRRTVTLEEMQAAIAEGWAGKR
jgi:antitoxin PrlF